jgi:hypothetical protein
MTAAVKCEATSYDQEETNPCQPSKNWQGVVGEGMAGVGGDLGMTRAWRRKETDTDNYQNSPLPSVTSTRASCILVPSGPR